MINKATRKGLLVDYDYSKDLDASRQISKPYPLTPDIWPRNRNDEQDDVIESEESEWEEGLTEADIALQKDISEEYKMQYEAFYQKHGQRTVR